MGREKVRRGTRRSGGRGKLWSGLLYERGIKANITH